MFNIRCRIFNTRMMCYFFYTCFRKCFTSFINICNCKILSPFFFILVLERPTSQMSYLEHFLKETGSTRHGSVDSVEGDIEDNRAPSITSSKSNLSELSIVSILICI